MLTRPFLLSLGQSARKRQALLEATEKSLTKIAKEVGRRKNKPLKAAEIGLKVGKVLGHYKMGKHFDCEMGEGSLQCSRRPDSIEQEEKLDGIYVIRTSEPREPNTESRQSAIRRRQSGDRRKEVKIAPAPSPQPYSYPVLFIPKAMPPTVI